MKLPIIAAALLAAAALTQAQVPGLINYQGRLTTPSGAPASGTKNFSISIYDAETGGNILYTEAVGPVTLDSAGVYSFQFGTTGTSNTQVTETLATTDGSAASFQKILANTGVVAGTLSVTDGTYTWSQSAGSSSEDDFGVAYSSSLRRVTVTYFNGAPVAGKAITAAYKYATSGITGAISSGSQHWMAISIDGVAQAGRQRVLAVPFAINAAHAVNAVHATTAAHAPINMNPYEDKVADKVYFAESAGFVFAELRSPSADGATSTVYIGNSADALEPFSIVQSGGGWTWVPSAGGGGVSPVGSNQTMVPIPKGYYWKASNFNVIKFVSFK